VTLDIEYRHFGGDGGPAVRVYGDVGGRSVQLLRFDCFAQAPHYHYDPQGRDERCDLEGMGLAESSAWTLEQLRMNLGAMIEKAGYPEVAARLDAAAVAASLPQVEEAMQASE
jgi:hypothetical protein